MLQFPTDWKTSEAYNKFKSSPEYQAVIGKFGTSGTSEDLLLCSSAAAPTLTAPTVEIVSWIHHSSNITPEFEKVVFEKFEVFNEAITTQSPYAAGGMAAGWGQVEFDLEGVPSRRFTALIGWKSVEAHTTCKGTLPFRDNIHLLSKNGNAAFEMGHYFFLDLAEKI
jgi:hypothetical protein